MSNPTPDTSPTSERLTPEAVAGLLDTAMRARQSGNIAAARALLRALSAQAPDAPRVWLALALVAETRQEQRRALERVLALDPRNTLAQRGLARIGAAAPAAHPAEPATSAPAEQPAPAVDYTTKRLPEADEPDVARAEPGWNGQAAFAPAESVPPRAAPALTPTAPAEEERRARAIRWPLYAIAGVSLVVVLLAALLLRPDWFGRPGLPPAATPALPEAAAGVPTAAAASPALGQPTAAPGLVATSAPAPTAAAGSEAGGQAATSAPAAETALAQPSAAPTAAAAQPTPKPTAQPTATPEPTARPALTPGTVVKQGQWSVVLLRPDYIVPLDGSIGTFQPRGRFLLALVAIANDGTAPARIPNDLLTVVDRDGTRYQPLPAVSTAYLDAYGRGQHGDLSMEDQIPADGGNKSVPLIFDVPANARGLTLMVKGAPLGWEVGQ